MKSLKYFLLIGFFSVVSFSAFAQDDEIPAEFELGSLRAKIGIGFSYDVLRDPANVSFDYPEGRAFFNIPAKFVMPEGVAGSFIADAFGDTSVMDDGSKFEPELSAGQQQNLGFQVMVPMMGGVCSFGYTNNFDIAYSTFLGNSNIGIDTTMRGDMGDIDFLLKGRLNVPLSATLGWRTMTFGYAFQPNDLLTFGFNIHRHIFELNLNALVAADFLGKAGVTGDVPISIPIDYSSDDVFGYASSNYRAEAWSPALGVKCWRLGLTSRFGVNTKAKGHFDAVYSVPFFIDKESFNLTFSDSLDLEYINNFITGKTDSVTYHSTRDADWKIPQGHTVTFDLMKRKIFLAYTKIIGDLEMKHVYEGNDGDIDDTLDNRTDLDLGISVDNIIVLGMRFSRFQFTTGIFTLDARVFENSGLLSGVIPEEASFLTAIDGKPMLPILSMGTMVGTTMNVLLQFDLLPLPTFKTGIVYHF